MDRKYRTTIGLAIAALIVGSLSSFGGNVLAQDTGKKFESSKSETQSEWGSKKDVTPSAHKKSMSPSEGATSQTETNRGPMSSAAQRAQADSIRLSMLDIDEVKQLQTSLQEQGFYQGQVDGMVGAKTIQALRRFYTEQAKLASEGRILATSAENLGVNESEIERVRGEEAKQPEAKRQEMRKGESTSSRQSKTMNQKQGTPSSTSQGTMNQRSQGTTNRPENTGSSSNPGTTYPHQGSGSSKTQPQSSGSNTRSQY